MCATFFNSFYNIFTPFHPLFRSAAGKYFHDNTEGKFLILEANDYIGGRVKNVDFHGHNIPLGAGWLHEVNEDHILYKKAKEYNLKTFTDEYWLSTIDFR